MSWYDRLKGCKMITKLKIGSKIKLAYTEVQYPYKDVKRVCKITRKGPNWVKFSFRKKCSDGIFRNFEYTINTEMVIKDMHIIVLKL